MSGRSFFSLLRPSNSLLIGSLASASVVAAVPGTAIALPFQCGVAWALMASAAYALNDLVDLELDQENKPWRYLPSIGYRPLWIKWLIGILLGLGIVVVSFAGAAISAFAVVWAALTCGYSLGVKKRAGVIANFIAAAAVAGAAGPGLVLGGVHQRFLAIFPILFLLMLSREIFKDVEDFSGDLLVGRRTLPVLIGLSSAGRLAAIAASCGWLTLMFLASGPVWIKITELCLSLVGISWSLRFVWHPPAVQRARSAQRQSRLLSVAVFVCFLLSIGHSR